jgi:hypothetical protein
MFHVPFSVRASGLVLVGLLMWATPSLAEEPEACNVCSANSSNLQTIASALNSQNPENPARLEKAELKKIEKGRKELVERLINKQEALYRDQEQDFWPYARAFIKVFGRSDDSKALFETLASPESIEAALKTSKRKDAKLEDPKVIEAIALMKSAHTRIWYRDPEVRNVVSAMYGGKKDGDKLIQKMAKRHFEDPARIAEMDRTLTSQYLEAREALFKKRKTTSYDKDDLKNLDIEFNLDDPQSSAPSDEHKNLTLEQLQDLALNKSAGNNQPSVFCQPFPNDPKYMSDTDPLLNTIPDGDVKKRLVPAPLNTKVVVHEETCDLSQTFESNATEVDANSRSTIRACLDKAKSNPACVKGLETVTASVKSCADTRMSSNPKYPTNLDLSNARSASMARAFSEETKSIFGIDAIASRESDEVRASYENAYADSSGKSVLTGTCGPRPPKGYNTEPWMPSSKQFCATAPSSLSPKELEECLSLSPKNQLWKCDPAPKVPFKNKDQISEYYKPYRKASIVIQYTCKDTITTQESPKGKGGGVAFEQVDPRKPFLESLQCGVFFKCFPPKVRISTYPPDRGGNGGGSSFNFNWDWLKRIFVNEKKHWGSTRCPKF